MRNITIAACVACLVAACDAPVPPAFDAQRVIDHVEVQCAWGPRVPNSAASDSVVAYIARTAGALGATVRLQRFEVDDPYGDRTLRLTNVIASFAPGRGKRVMLCAHFDSRPRADQEPDSTLHDQPIPGAIDGASGVGVLLEIGRLVAAATPPGVGVDLVFFDGEDYGKVDDLAHYLLGSKYFANNLDGYRPRSAILLDMVGGATTTVAREAYSRTNSPELTDELFARAGRLGLDYFVDLNGPPVYDDHVPLIEAGLEAVDLFGYNYRYWHTLQDTPDKCDAEKITQLGTLLVNFLYDYPY